MAYETNVSMPPRPVGRKDIIFAVRRDGVRWPAPDVRTAYINSLTSISSRG